MTDNLLARQTYRNLLKSTMDAASIRNALGDIGNRIGLGNGAKTNPIELVKQQQTAAAAVSTVTSNVRSENIAKPKAAENEKEEASSNNTCVMLEVTSDEEEDVELVLEEDDDDDNDNDDDEVIDIDSGDLDNPQLFADYVRSIYSYLVQLERKYRISPQFLAGKTITHKMRAVLVDWLMQVHAKFRLLQETMYLCVYLIDAYLERVDVSKMQLQLVGVTALLLACKYEEMYVPAIDDFVYMTDNTYTAAEIRSMEVAMCKTLNFAFGKPLPLHFLRRFSKAGQADPKHHILAKYFMELSLHDIEFATIDPSYLAASSLCLSFKLLNGPQWNKNMEFHSGYKQASLVSGMQKIARLILKTREPDYKYRAAYNKHASSKCMRISLAPELNGELIRELAVQTTTSLT